MKGYKTILFAILILFCISCKNNNSIKEKELELKERELELREKELKEKENNNHPTDNKVSIPVQNSQPQYQPNVETIVAKYVYVIFKVQQPKLHHTDSKYISGLDGITSSYTIPESNFVTFEDYVFTSEIKEVPSYNENKQYEYMDRMEANVRERLSYIDMNFDSEVFMNVRERDEQQKLKDYKSKIIDRKIKVFNSYKDASIHRNNNKGKF